MSPRVCRSNRVLVFLRSTRTPSIADIDLSLRELLGCLSARSLSGLTGCLFRGQEFDTHVGSQIAKQLEPPKKADAEFGYILSEVSHRDPVIHTIRVRSVA